MKKLFTFVALMTIAINAQSQTLTATLQQGDVITPFYGATAFKEAYEAANDGAIITLSPGLFDQRTIEKAITVYGSGAYGDDDQITYVPNIWIKHSGVRVEGLYVQSQLRVQNESSKNNVVRHCYIKDLLFDSNPSDNIFNQCTIDNLNYGGTGELFTNCVINFLNSNGNALAPMTFINSTIFKGWGLRNNMFRNCVVGIDSDTPTFESPGQYYNNVFFRYCTDGSKNSFVVQVSYADGCVHSGNSVDTFGNLFNGKIDLSLMPNTSVQGDDNTKVGPEGGAGYKLYPAIPRIISKQIDRQTDANGKINVSIQVKAE